MKPVKVVVVGAGVIGFSTAVCLIESVPNVSVTLIADKFSPDTTSDGAAGILFAAQFPDIAVERQRRWFKDSFDHLFSIAQTAEAPSAGVMLSSGCQIFKQVPSVRRPYWADLVIGFREMSELELRRFPQHVFGNAFTTLKCECSRYLPWLRDRFIKAGGSLQQRRVLSLDELSGFDLIVNCSGLESKTLAPDDSVYPVRGQILKVHAPWIQHFTRSSDGKTYIYPGIDGVTLGGTRQEHDWRLQLDDGDTASILQRCTELEPSLVKAKVLRKWVGLRPSRKNARLERDVVEVSGRRVGVVHNYGHGGWGVTLAWGCAVEAVSLIKDSVRDMGLRAKL